MKTRPLPRRPRYEVKIITGDRRHKWMRCLEAARRCLVGHDVAGIMRTTSRDRCRELIERTGHAATIFFYPEDGLLEVVLGPRPAELEGVRGILATPFVH